MKKPSIFTNKVSEAETTTTSTPQTSSKQSKVPFDAHEVLDFYKSHSEEMKAVLRTMKGRTALNRCLCSDITSVIQSDSR